MEGRLRETDYQTVKERVESPQSSLNDWAEEDETLVAVVREDAGTGIDEVCDEHVPALGMPERSLKKFLEVRAGYRTNSAVSDPHNKAFEDCNLESVYERHLQTGAARGKVRNLARRVSDGENITLVCFEGSGYRCHRHILRDAIERQAESDTSSEFTFVVPS